MLVQIWPVLQITSPFCCNTQTLSLHLVLLSHTMPIPCIFRLGPTYNHRCIQISKQHLLFQLTTPHWRPPTPPGQWTKDNPQSKHAQGHQCHHHQTPTSLTLEGLCYHFCLSQASPHLHSLSPGAVSPLHYPHHPGSPLQPSIFDIYQVFRGIWLWLLVVGLLRRRAAVVVLPHVGPLLLLSVVQWV
jgi:hypothetical protein